MLSRGIRDLEVALRCLGLDLSFNGDLDVDGLVGGFWAFLHEACCAFVQVEVGRVPWLCSKSGIARGCVALDRTPCSARCNLIRCTHLVSSLIIGPWRERASLMMPGKRGERLGLHLGPDSTCDGAVRFIRGVGGVRVLSPTVMHLLQSFQFSLRKDKAWRLGDLLVAAVVATASRLAR